MKMRYFFLTLLASLLTRALKKGDEGARVETYKEVDGTKLSDLPPEKDKEKTR